MTPHAHDFVTTATPAGTVRAPAWRYMEYLTLVSCGKAGKNTPPLDALDERLLNMLGVAWHAGEMPTVLQVMERAEGMSSTTAHRRLKTLREHGFITLLTNEDDNRIKHVVGTEQAERHFTQKGRYLAQAQGQ